MQELLAQADAGRGLWVGLHPATSHPFTLSVEGWHLSDPHCTLAHLGKNKPHLVDASVRGAKFLAQQYAPVPARVGATARFKGSERDGDPLVWLLEQPKIRRIASDLRSFVDVPDSDRFDYKPHLTLTRVPRSIQAPTNHPPDLTLEFKSIVVVCGDARVYYPLEGTR